MFKTICLDVSRKNKLKFTKNWNQLSKYNLSRNIENHKYSIWYSNPILTRINEKNFSTITRRGNILFQKSDSVLGGSKVFPVSGEENTSKPESSEEDDRKKRENQARALKFTLIAFAVIFAGAAGYILIAWGSPKRNAYGDILEDEFSKLPLPIQYLKRSLHEIRNVETLLADPSREKLLPDPVKLPFIQPPYTVLIELTDVLVHPEWTYRTGWRFKKRPGVEYFLKQLATNHQFEIVIYTQESGFTAFPIIDALDTQKVVMYTLFRDSTKYTDGHHIKDLEKINRDLSRVIMIDCNPNSVQNHRNNAIILPKWFGNDDDRVLFDLAALLRTISGNEINDVRPVLSHYANFDDPITEFRKKQKEYAEISQQKASSPAGKTLPGFSFVSSFLRKS